MSHVPRPLSRSVPRTVIAVATCASVAAAGLVAAAPAAYAASPNVVIAEVYGGGGNSGAPLDSDFVELFNRGASPVDLTGWKVAYWSAAGTTASTTTLAGSLPVGGRYLVKEATGANTAAPDLPTPDATGTIGMSATAGRVAVLDASGQMLAFEPPHFGVNKALGDVAETGSEATVGGMVAAGLSGPRRPWVGAVRDFVLGCRLISGRGKQLRFGGEVMKNVAGYDVSRLMAGALGTLSSMRAMSASRSSRASNSWLGSSCSERLPNCMR